MCGGAHAWWGGMHDKGVCVVGCVHGAGRTWQEGMYGRGHAW